MGEILFPGWDPVIFALGPLQVRWYSMMYVLGFLVGHTLLTRMARSRFFPVDEEKVPDLVFWLVLGVMLGGRVGYCLFYRPELLASWRVIAVWEGGLSFHGGLIGVMLTAWLWSRKQGVSPFRTMDAMAIAGTPGVFFVRCSNFINGELFGRVTDDSVPWAMRFPSDPRALELMRIEPGLGIRERESAIHAAMQPDPATGQSLWDAVRESVPLRHPSQLYEAIGEGLVMFFVLWFVYRRTLQRPWGNGAYAGLFMLGYGIARFIVEFFRQPDSQFRGPDDPLGTVLGPLTMGQVLCSAMILYGLGAIWLGRSRRQAAPEA